MSNVAKIAGRPKWWIVRAGDGKRHLIAARTASSAVAFAGYPRAEVTELEARPDYVGPKISNGDDHIRVFEETRIVEVTDPEDMLALATSRAPV